MKGFKGILDEREIYTVSEKAITYEIAFASGVASREPLEEGRIIREIRESLRRELRREERFAGFAEWLVEREESGQAVQPASTALGLQPTAEGAAAIPALCAAVQELVTRWTPALTTPSPAPLEETAHE